MWIDFTGEYDGASMRPRHFSRGVLERPGEGQRPEFAASMRPRHFSRGVRASTCSRAAMSPCFNEAPAFQPGSACWPRAGLFRARRCFNEAPAFQPGSGEQEDPPPSLRHSASMRPRHFSRGVAAGDGHAQFVLRASMRPRHFSRGVGSNRILHHEGLHASMRPRHFSRGVLLQHSEMLLCTVLLQ